VQNPELAPLFASLIHAARRTLTLANPYFVPDDSLLTAITSAAQRGVENREVIQPPGVLCPLRWAALPRDATPAWLVTTPT
jgi:phosphatidylserine/phosphatidylglycerophosphate/cardiolipin synthase-like enzyme